LPRKLKIFFLINYFQKLFTCFFKKKSPTQCLHRWQKVLDPALVKGPWTEEEDKKVIELVEKHGPEKWSNIASFLPGRIGKQCRERYPKLIKIINLHFKKN
jgi:hypothetical protein